ncbi:TIGR02597 family protein [Akkermansiaceae bacterium]|nr:TIGR02597 family protein [Akkermansiaceae bacterium]
MPFRPFWEIFFFSHTHFFPLLESQQPKRKINPSQTSRPPALVAAAMLLIVQALPSAPVYTDPIGFNKITCLTNSDTIVGVPFRAEGSLKSVLASAPVTAGDGETATLTISNSSLNPGALGTHYVKFDGGTRDGRWYDITANTANTLTIDLNGDNLTGVLSGNSLVIARYWTLDSLFPPAQATTSWTLDPESGIQVPNGHAIVSSLGTAPSGRRTQILFPNNATLGTNRPSTDIFYINRNTNLWVRVAGSVTPPGETIIFPDTYITIRHVPSVTHSTILRVSGDVVTNNQSIALSTRPLGAGSNDNYVAIPRPVDVSLWDLNIVQSGAFTASSGTSPAARRDQLLVYNNSIPQINRPVDAIYYYLVDKWVKVGDATQSSQNNVIIPSSAGLIVRKYNTAGGVTSHWINTPSY